MYYSRVGMSHNLFTPSSVDGHLGGFQFASLMSKAAVNILVPVFINIGIHFSWVKISLKKKDLLERERA